MNIEMALKSRSYILDLDHVKLSLGIFFFSELFNGEAISFQDLPFLLLSKTPTKKPKILCFAEFYLWEWVQSKVVKCNL